MCKDDPEVQLKRELWGRLLLSALGESFEGSDELFVTHTYLALVAELIARGDGPAEICVRATDGGSGNAQAAT